jgi:hypothetical protein
MNSHPEIIIVPSFFFLIGYIVWVWVSSAQRKQRLRLITEFHTRLLDKLGSVKDFGDFLQTDAGNRFMKDLASEPVVAGPHDRILRAAQIGVVLIFLGIGLLMVSFFWSPVAPESGQNAFGALGAIALSLGIGFTVSAGASYRLAGMLGLLNRPQDPSSVPVTSRP